MNSSDALRTDDGTKGCALYYRMLDMLTGGGELDAQHLADHIPMMINGTVQYKGPLWKRRIFPEDGMVIELDSFEDYLLRHPRKGLGLESLYQIRGFLQASRRGEEALKLLRAEIENFDQKADEAQWKWVRKDKGKVPDVGINQFAGYDNVIPSPKDRGTNKEYGFRRLLKERPDLAERVEAGELSVHKASVLSGIRPASLSISSRTDPEDAVEKIKRILGEDYWARMREIL